MKPRIKLLARYYCCLLGLLYPQLTSCSILFESQGDADVAASPDAAQPSYLAITERTWFEAVGRCDDLGGNLFTLRANSTLAKKTAIALLLGSGLTWMGLSDTDDESIFRWITGEDIEPGSEQWGQFQPEETASEADIQDCVVIDSAFKWQDKDCDKKYPAICEFN